MEEGADQFMDIPNLFFQLVGLYESCRHRRASDGLRCPANLYWPLICAGTELTGAYAAEDGYGSWKLLGLTNWD